MNYHVESLNSSGAYETQIEKWDTPCYMAVCKSVTLNNPHLLSSIRPVSLVVATLVKEKLLFRTPYIDCGSFKAVMLDYL